MTIAKSATAEAVDIFSPTRPAAKPDLIDVERFQSPAVFEAEMTKLCPKPPPPSARVHPSRHVPAVVTLRLIDGSERLAEAPSSAVEADAGGVPRAAEDGRYARRVEALPGDEQQQLSIRLAQLRERRRDMARFAARGWARGQERLVGDRAGQSRPPGLGAAVVGEHASRGRIEPVERRLALRDVVEAAPADRKRLRDDVDGVVAENAPLRVAKDAVVVGVVERGEAGGTSWVERGLGQGAPSGRAAAGSRVSVGGPLLGECPDSPRRFRSAHRCRTLLAQRRPPLVDIPEF